MAVKTTVNGLDDAVARQLGLYNAHVVEGVKLVTAKAAKDLVAKTKQQRYIKDSGKFRKAIAAQKAADTPSYSLWQWFVRAPHYRLSHLLEHGHEKKNGGKKTVAYGFIGKALDEVGESYIKDVEKVVTDG